MSRSNRLFQLLQLLREHRHPVTAEALSEKLAVSVRTIYRDIESLRQLGADIEGEAGLGFLLKDGFLLPPLMFSIDEIEALIIGSRWVLNHGDAKLSEVSSSAIAKINKVIPKKYQYFIDSNTIFTPSFNCKEATTLVNPDTAELIRQSIRFEKVCQISYADGKGDVSDRKIHPFGLSFFDNVQVIMAWCCLRDDFRHFRVDRIQSLVVLSETYSPNKQTLLQDWQRQEGVDLTVLQSF